MEGFMAMKFMEAVQKDMMLIEEEYMMHLHLYESWASATDDAIIDIMMQTPLEDIVRSIMDGARNEGFDFSSSLSEWV
tara:strand:- start:6229 stop:6462 length:234 start_codon:yes stop_codon:yes gene_type:complete